MPSRGILLVGRLLCRKAEVADIVGMEVDIPGSAFCIHTPADLVFRCAHACACLYG